MARPLIVLKIALLMVSTSWAGAITGIVANAITGKPVVGAQVTLMQSGVVDTTDTAGFYRFDSLTSGSYHLLFSADSYDPLVRNDVYVAGVSAAVVDAALLPLGGEKVDRMTVTASSFAKAPDMTASSKIMNFDELLRAPGAMMDAQRAVQSMPGVASGADNINEIIVRGGTPGENLFIMDNIEISNPNHFAAQGSGGGVISLVNPLLVKGLVFNAGAPPAQYGGKASSVLDITLREGNNKMILGGVDIGVAGLGLHAEGPLWPQATFMASGTKSFLDLIARFEKTTAVPQYWGGQAKITQKAGWATVTANTVFGRNNIHIPFADRDLGTQGENISSSGDVYAGGVSASGLIGSALSATISVFASGNTFVQKEYTSDSSAPEVVFYQNDSREQEQTVKLGLGIDLPRDMRLLVGGHVRRADFDIGIEEMVDTLYTYSADSQKTPVLDAQGNPITTAPLSVAHGVGFKYGGYFSAIVPLGRLRVAPGVRFDGFDYINGYVVSPRMNAAFSLLDNLDITAAFGIQAQDPAYTDLVIDPANKNLKPFRALTSVGGLELTFAHLDAKATVEGYYKQYSDLPVDSSLFLSKESNRFTATNVLVSEGRGTSYGLEFYLQKKLTNHFSGSIAYSYSQSWREDLRLGREKDRYPADYDFRHNCSFTGGYKHELLDKEWYRSLSKRLWFRLLSPVCPIADRMELSLQWRYLGGRPYTEPTYNPSYRIWSISPNADLNTSRYPAYHRLDLRFERRYAFGFLHLIYYFDLQNIYGRTNVWQYLFVDGKDSKSTIYQIPFFPAGGMIVGF